MDYNKLPLNKKTTIIARKFILATAKRTSGDEVTISYINLKNHKEVLRILQSIKKGTQILQYIQSDYWDMYADGNYIRNFDFSMFKDREMQIKISSADRSLEIVGFKDGIPQEMNAPSLDRVLKRGKYKIPKIQ